MTIRAHLLHGLMLSSLALAGCSKVPACGDPEALSLATAHLKERAAAQLKARFAIPFLNSDARETLARFFAPDSISLSDMRAVSQDKELKLRKCAAKADLAYEMAGRVDKAKIILGHGAVSGQSVAYMLDGEPYASVVKKMSPHVSMGVSYSIQATDDGHIHVEVQELNLPIF